MKSAQGTAQEEAAYNIDGFLQDRRWIVVDEERRRVSARKLPRLATISCSLSDQALTLSQTGFRVSLPLVVQEHIEQDVELTNGLTARARFMGNEVATHLSGYLGRKCALYQLCERKAAELAYAPVHLMSESSLKVLNDKLEQPVPMARFRPNIVVAGSKPFDEDNWSTVTINGHGFRNIERTARCTIPNIDIESGQTAPEPMKTLSNFRRIKASVDLGIYLQPSGEGSIKLGDPVQIS